ncbi:MAG: hypothetical protein PVJ68_03135 [Candidatus Thiodiazotropha sp.]|jgi:hypothetical protein
MDIRKSFIANLLLTTTLSVGCSTALLATDLDYTYVEGRYILDGEIEDVDDYDGFSFGGSFQFTDDIFAFASYTDAEYDDLDGDFNTFVIGGGYIYPIKANWDANFTLAYATSEADIRGYEDYDENGYVISGGVRGLFKPEIELSANLNHGKLDESDTWITLGGDYYFTPEVSAGINFNIGGDADQFSIGAKYYFK